MTTLVTIDFETLPIFQRPDYPPEPVGLAVQVGGEPVYYTGANLYGGRERLAHLWNDPTVQFVMHNAKFDLAVAQERWELPTLPWHRVHDTMLLAFLNDPYASSFALKPLAQRLLGMVPEERDDVAGWVQEHKRELEARWAAEHPDLPLRVQKGKEGAWIFAVPHEIVAPYAKGDVVRTTALFDHLMPRIERLGMGAAYDRERQLMPILIDNERRGMRVDLPALEQDIETYSKAFEHVETALRFVLRASGLNFDADQDVAAVLIERGVVPQQSFALTKAGKLRMSKEELLPDMFTGSVNGTPGIEVAQALGYRNRLATCLNTFMKPWAAQAARNGGYITTNWSQVRGEGGARTGRATTNNHNFLNLPKSFAGRDDQYEHPAFLGVPELPLCRQYVLPDDGEVFLHRDFSGQEMRVFAHFEQGGLQSQYQETPKLDVHSYVGGELMRVAGREIARTPIKVMNFQALYGGGAPALSKKLRVSLAEAKQLKSFHDRALPGRKLLNEEIVRLARRGEPIRTWGGRLYWPTPPEDGRETFYKLLNYLVQGSAADLTKQALIDWGNAGAAARFLVTVYDEINLSAAPERAVGEMALLRTVMEAPRLSVPMLSDGKMGPSWGRLEKCE